MPIAEAMDPESCYLGFEISFSSNADKAAIERVFDFVRDECSLRILPPHSRLSDYLELIGSLPEDAMRLGEILVRIGALTQAELDEGLATQSLAVSAPAEDGASAEAPAFGEARPQIGEILVEQNVVQPELVEAAVARQKQVTDKKAAESRLIRIQADKLDRLIDLVGELVIAGASVSLLAGKSGLSELVEAASLSGRLVEGIRDAALQLRMVQIGETFNRFNRVVRDTSRELGKEVELVISGGETELDKSMVEKIGDPLMHLVRNAMDHGLEQPAVREASGKPARGRLELNAFHDSGSIVIEVVDDGAGLNRERILAKAIERGLTQARSGAVRHRDPQPDLRAGLLHRRKAHQHLRPRCRHGCGAAQHPGSARQRGCELDDGRRFALCDPSAADAGDHRRLPGGAWALPPM
jgi:two-component system chemotaxis sensor kinase CheA